MMFYWLIDYMFCFVLDLISDYMIGFADYMMGEGAATTKTPKHQITKTLNRQQTGTKRAKTGKQAFSNSTDGKSKQND
jgi:hypothetical protein